MKDKGKGRDASSRKLPPQAPRAVVHATLRKPHPLVAQAREALLDSPKDHAGILVGTTRQRLAIRVSPACLDRALRIMNALLKALDNRKVRVEAGLGQYAATRIWLGGTALFLKLGEKLKRVESPDPATTGRAGAYAVGPTGMLHIRIDGLYPDHCKQVWRDAPGLKLEDQVDSILEALPALARAGIEERKRNLFRNLNNI
jgi:hypothetical protein